MKKTVSIVQLKKRFGVVSLITFIIILALFEISNNLNFISYLQLCLHGNETIATVIDSKTNESKVTLNSGKGDFFRNEISIVDSYCIKYRFETKEDMEAIASSKWFAVPESDWSHSLETKQIDVIYDRNSPEVNSPRIVVKKYFWNMISKLFAGILGAMAFASVTIFIMYTDLKRRGLYRKD